MHSSLMTTSGGSSLVLIPWHPEELYKPVLVLEEVYKSLPEDTNKRQAVAKAVIWAASSFLEGCLQQFIEQICSEEKTEVPKLNGLANRRQFVMSRAKQKKVNATRDSTRFVEDNLEGLRNKLDHGDKVDTSELRLDNISFFREATGDYLEQAYGCFDKEKPGWLKQ